MFSVLNLSICSAKEKRLRRDAGRQKWPDSFKPGDTEEDLLDKMDEPEEDPDDSPGSKYFELQHIPQTSHHHHHHSHHQHRQNLSLLTSSSLDSGAESELDELSSTSGGGDKAMFSFKTSDGPTPMNADLCKSLINLQRLSSVLIMECDNY